MYFSVSGASFIITSNLLWGKIVKSKRDQLAEEYGNNYSLTHREIFLDAFKEGWDACEMNAMEESDEFNYKTFQEFCLSYHCENELEDPAEVAARWQHQQSAIKIAALKRRIEELERK